MKNIGFLAYLKEKDLTSMKCDSCGYKNGSSEKTCRICGELLAKRPDSGELADMLERLSDRSDALTATKFDSIMKWVFFVSAIILFVFILIFSGSIPLAILVLFLSALAGVAAGYPKFMWKLEIMRLQCYTNADDLVPNDFWALGRRISYWILFAFALFCAVLELYFSR